MRTRYTFQGHIPGTYIQRHIQGQASRDTYRDAYQTHTPGTHTKDKYEETHPTTHIGTQAGEDPDLTDLCLRIAYNRATARIDTPTLSEASAQPPLPTIVDNPEQPEDQWREIQNLLSESTFNVSRASSHRSRSRTPA